MRSTVAASIGRFSATIPPNAERSSHSSARWYAVARSSATATPHGLACLMIAHGRPVAEVVHELPRGVGVVEVEVARARGRCAGRRRPTSSSCRAGGSAPPAGAGSRRSAASRRCARARARGGAGSASPSWSHSTIAASYAAVRANASSASARRVSRRRARRRSRSSSSTPSYCVGARDDRRPTRGSSPPRAPSPGPPMSIGLDVGSLEERVEVATRRGRTARCRTSRGRRGATPCRGRRGSRRGSSGAA